ncbi:MAG: hypothetical protein U9R15_14285, partial [Chloroflexota bacterium]|nr:hypothetical protein [Chloroflexota bacterium]
MEQTYSLTRPRCRARDQAYQDQNRGLAITGSGLRYLRRAPLGFVGALLLASFALVAIAAPLIAPYDPLSIDVSNGLAAPSWTHLLGTDHLGRDVLSRLLFGARA